MRLLNTCLVHLPRAAQTAHGGQGGFAFIVVLGILLLVTGLAIVAFNTSDTDRQISSNSLSTTRAYYAAEAGAIRAMAQLADSSNWRAGYSNVSVGNSKFSVQVIDSFTRPALKDSLILLSTGNAIGSPNGTESAVEVLMAPKKTRRFRYAAFGDTLVYLNGHAQIDGYNSDSGIYVPDGPGGNVGGNDLIYMNGSDDIYGDVSTPDTIMLNGAIDIYGDTNYNAPPDYMDSITASEMAYAQANNAAPGGLSLTGGASYNAATGRLRASGSTSTITMNSGIYYFNDIDLQSGSKLVIPVGAKVTIYLRDSLIASGGTMINSTLKPENLQIYSTGPSIYLTGNVDLYAAIYAPNASIYVNGNSSIYGSAIGKSVYVNGNGGIHYDRALARLGEPGKGKYKKVAWRVL